MSEIQIEEHAAGIRVRTGAQVIEHLLAAGGTWSSVLFTCGSGRNLLRQPAGSALRVLGPSGPAKLFCEKNERGPKLSIDNSGPAPAIIAEGTYRDEQGQALPVGFRRRTEYCDHGLVWSTLDIMSDSGCDNVVELCALELPLRTGFSGAFARFHPTQAGSPDLLGGRGWYPLINPPVVAPASVPAMAFLSRFTPLQLCCYDLGGEGIDVFPCSELALWDFACKPDAGLGQFAIEQEPAGTLLRISPYCMSFRQISTRIQGRISLRLGIGLPQMKARAAQRSHVLGAPLPSGEELARLAKSGISVVRLPSDISPPADELRRVLDAAHKVGMKLVRSINIKELAFNSPDVGRYGAEWMHMAAPSLGPIYTRADNGDGRVLMCLKSGWFDHCKKVISDAIAQSPLDGLFIEGAAAHPCCHPQHARAPFHSDIEQVLELLAYARSKIPDGLLGVDLGGSPSMVLGNIADC
ncbi:MAG TPA: hypothetical protein VGP72_03570 [Planctomycetota bacterium]|jgi:hypothetical protein